MNNKALIKSLVDDVAEAIKLRDLSRIQNKSLSEETLRSWVENTVDEHDQRTVLESGFKSMQVFRNKLIISDEKLKSCADVPKPRHWRFYELSPKNFMQYDVSVFFTMGNQIMVAEFVVGQFDETFYLIKKFNLTLIDTPIRRLLNDSQNSFKQFQAATQWQPDVSSTAGENAIEKTEQHYRELLSKYNVEDPQIQHSEIQDKDAFKAIEKHINKTFPTALLNWWLGESIISFRKNDWYGFELFEPEKMRRMMENQNLTHSVKTMGLVEVMDYFHSGEFKQVLSSDDYDNLNAKYTIVGVYRLNDSDALYLYFNDDHQFGILEYNHDWLHFGRTEWDAEYRTRLITSIASYPLNTLVRDLLTLSGFQVWLNRD